MGAITTTKTGAVVHNNITLTASAGDTTSDAVDLQDGHESLALIKITNGATGPTVPAQVQIQLSSDNSNYYDYGGPLVGGTTNAGVYSWGIDIPRGTKYLKTVSGSNTGQNVTLRVEVVEVASMNY